MSSTRLIRASVAALVGTALCTQGEWVQGAEQAGQDAELDEITVTGSRVITDNLRSPTPITSVSKEDMIRTTPSDIPDALNKLPEILGSRTPRTQGNGATNNGGNVLSLRNFGVSRTLVLLDGHRVAPANQDGSVNVDTLPQILMSRVDIVTGGASAVYGSDAVAGVINFVLDKNFTGFRFNADAGISKYGDGEQGQFAVAWGTELFGGRGHFETSGRYREQAMIPISERPYGENGQQWLLTGTGTVANPFVNTPYARVFNSGPYGNVSCGTACAYNTYTFNSPGVLSPLVHGIPTGSGNIESGGDGAYVKYGTFRSGISMKEWFGRFSYDLTDSITAMSRARGRSRPTFPTGSTGLSARLPAAPIPCLPTIHSSPRRRRCSWARALSAVRPQPLAGDVCRRPRPRRRPAACRRLHRRCRISPLPPISGTTWVGKTQAVRIACTSQMRGSGTGTSRRDSTARWVPSRGSSSTTTPKARTRSSTRTTRTTPGTLRRWTR